MGKVKASVVVPAYNAADAIGECLESLVSQKPGFAFEIVVVDDGSKDATAEIAGGFAGVRVVKQANAGPAAARNNGAESALGEIVVFTDSDCVAEKNWLREMVVPFDEEGVAGVQGTYKSKQKGLVPRLIQLEIEHRHSKMRRQRFIDFMGSYSAAYRKDIFNGIGGFDSSFPIASGEDTELSFRVQEAGHKMVFNPKAVVFHRHPEGLWNYFKVKFFRAFWRVKVYGKHRSKVVKDSYTSQTLKAQIALFYLGIAGLASTAFGFGGLLFSAAFFGLLFLSSLPFALWAARRDLAVGLASPFLVFARTAFFATGLVLGIVNAWRNAS